MPCCLTCVTCHGARSSQAITFAGSPDPLPRSGRLRRLDPERPRRHPAAPYEMEFVGHEVPAAGGLAAVRHRRLVARLDGGDEFVLDPEHLVRIQIFVASHE